MNLLNAGKAMWIFSKDKLRTKEFAMQYVNMQVRVVEQKEP